VLQLLTPVGLRRPDQQPNPSSPTEQTDNRGEHEDNGHATIMAMGGTDANGNSDVGPAEWPTVRAASLDPAEPAQA
jgi:hypothetical protein